jgi:hypothetical protein
MTDPATLLALADRCEQAAGVDQKAVMLAVVDALGLPSKQHYLIVRMIEIGAYESAAIALVPEGWTWGKFFGGSAECVSISGPSILFERGLSDKPALAICAAALRARAAMG